jgi:chloramphenicol 3-O-phosphotransferase
LTNEDQDMSGQIVLVTGTSGSGKTTTCATFARRAAEPYLMFGLDLLVGTLFPAKYTMFGEKRSEGYSPTQYGPVFIKAMQAMHEMVAAASRVGQSMVVDHLLSIDPPVLQDCIWHMVDVPVLLVCLKPSRDVLEKRVRQRQIDFIPPPIKEAMASAGGNVLEQLGEELAAATPWLYEHVYANDCYDLTLDSSAMSPEQVCECIEQRLRQGPGTAFATLRKRYPRPKGFV